MLVESLLVALLMRLPWRVRSPMLARLMLRCAAVMFEGGRNRRWAITPAECRGLAWRLRIVEACLALTCLERARRIAGLPPIQLRPGPIDTSPVSPHWLAWRYVKLAERHYRIDRACARLAARLMRRPKPAMPRDAAVRFTLLAGARLRLLELSG